MSTSSTTSDVRARTPASAEVTPGPTSSPAAKPSTTACGGRTATANESKENDGRGFVISGVGGLFELNTAEGNIVDNVVFTATATGYTVKTFEAQGSDHRGIVVNGTGNTFTGNVAQANDGFEWQVTVAGNTDGGGNKSHGGRPCSVAVVGTCN